MKIFSLVIVGLMLSVIHARAQTPVYLPERVYLYAGDPDTAQGFLLPFIVSPEKNVHKAAILVCPGGGYTQVAINHEGVDVARWLNNMGIDAYVVRYRVSSPLGKHYYPDHLNDVKAAMKLLMKGEYSRIGVMGFSAGGHLAGTYLTEEKQNADFGILIYPVVTTDSQYRHNGSFRALLGNGAGDDPPVSFSVEKRVTRKTPPLWLLHTLDDKAVPYQNSSLLYEAAKPFQPNTRLTLYEKGGHGFGMRTLPYDTEQWKETCAAWIKARCSD